ncbi:hypothetical protein C8A05DRAFT_33408 [Staphylotrichum tortipilum]|uniref:Uncharacterized protein n=1 Tax=Staphylotrichum tortipilum TaxID=2831512 RepID=A0AAN6RTW8_9PEZI|nr:hypothetical protein C8A05DRAFT_33408 [Staphylotrichum longicolle]
MAATDGLSDTKVLDAIKVLREAMDAIEQTITSKKGLEHVPQGAAATNVAQEWNKEKFSITDTTKIPVASTVSAHGPVTPSRDSARVSSPKRRARSPSPTDAGWVENKKRSPTKRGEMLSSVPVLNYGTNNGAETMDTEVPEVVPAQWNDEAPVQETATLAQENATPEQENVALAQEKGSGGQTTAEANLAGGDDFWTRANIRW